MPQLEFNNGIIQENTKNYKFTLLDFTGSFQSTNNAIEKNVQNSSLNHLEFHYNNNDNTQFFVDKTQYNMKYLDSSGIHSVASLNSLELLEISNSITGSTSVLFNIHVIQDSFAANGIIHSVTIEESKVKEESIDMHEKLLSHRNDIEKYGMFIGSLLGIATLMIPLFFSVEFVTVAPATLLFFSLPVFVYMRKQLRGSNKW